MAYSSIVKRMCKCGCGRPPTISFDGYFYAHAPQEIKDRQGKKAKKTYQAAVTRAKQGNLSRKVTKYAKLNDAHKTPEISLKQQWFNERRIEMTGTCQCGCGVKSQKKDDAFFRHCICHIFPQNRFESIALHPLNWVERTFWEGHHTNFDNQSMDKWVNMADWDDIKAKFYKLAPLLTDKERANKFYSHLEKLVLDTLT